LLDSLPQEVFSLEQSKNGQDEGFQLTEVGT